MQPEVDLRGLQGPGPSLNFKIPIYFEESEVHNVSKWPDIIASPPPPQIDFSGSTPDEVSQLLGIK